MPTYTYQCSSCEHVFDDFKKIADRDEPTTNPCPKCGTIAVNRPPSVAGFQFRDVQKASGDWTNLLQNIKRKNTSLSHKSTINV